MSVDSSQFLFREIEFEDDGFHAASFVAKYRRVTSLESLRDQLRHYCASLKNQLYEIINRDYKDFITIATKLDGVDDRVDHLRKPLIDLRCDLLNLHSGMVANMQAIQDKLDHRKEITDRKKVLESSLKCIEKLDTVEGIITNIENKTSQLQYLSKRRHLLRAINISLSTNANQIEASPAEYFPSSNIEVFEASELERASESLSSAITCLQELQQYKVKSGNDSTITPAIISTSTFTLNKTLDLRVHKLFDILTITLRRKLTALLTPAASLNNNQMGNSPSNQLICCHLIRSFVALGKGKDVEDIFAEVVILPLARGLLTPSRVDGTGGRGSFSGLHDTLHSILSHLSVNFKDCFKCVESSFPSPLLFAHDPPPNYRATNTTTSDSVISANGSNLSTFPEFDISTHKPNPPTTAINSDNISSDSDVYNQLESMVYTPHPDIDLIVKGIWIPISNILLEKFSQMFSIGIATTFHRCYYAIYRFIEHLGALISSDFQVDDDATAENNNEKKIERSTMLWIKRRLFDHPDIVAFNSKWGLELYFQLCRQEITSRIDYCYSMTAKQCIDCNIFTAMYIHEEGASPTSTSASIPLANLVVALRNIIAVQMSGYKFRVPFLEAMCLECLVCLHEDVWLPAISDRFLSLLIQIMTRSEIFLAQWAGVTTPHCTKELMMKLSTLPSKATTQPLKNPPITTTATTASSSSSSSGSKPVLSNGNIPSTTNSTATSSTTSTSSTFPPVSQVDLVSVLLDLHHILLWIKSSLIPYTQSKLAMDSDDENTTTALTTTTGSSSIIGKIFLHQLAAWRAAVMSLWLKLLSLVEAECKHTLQAVRGIAGKYRMTNKPAPETMSAYVPTILQPIRDFQKKFPELLNVISEYYNVLQMEDTSSTSASSSSSVPPGEDGEVLSAAAASSSSSSPVTSSPLTISQWRADLIESVTAHYLQLVVTLMGTVRQMDTALQRRSNRSNLTSKTNKFSTTGSTTSTANLVLTDSEKIQLQLLLDIRGYAAELESLGCRAASSKAYQGLLEEVAEASKILGEI